MEKWGVKFGKIVSKIKPMDLARSWKIFQGDQVKVIAGRCKGEEGKVIQVRRKNNQVIIEGVNLVYDH